MRDTHLLKQSGPFGGERHVEYEDRLEAPACCHCRVAQADGQLAVVSPVWVGETTPAGSAIDGYGGRAKAPRHS